MSNIEEYHNDNGVTAYSTIEFEDQTDEFDEGQYAAQNGEAKSTCPYKSSSKRKRMSWIGGWETCCLDGEFDIIKELQDQTGRTIDGNAL